MSSFASVILAVLVGAVVMAAGSYVTIRLSHRWGLLDQPGRHKRHNAPTPNLGGVPLFLAISAAIGAGLWLDGASISGIPTPWGAALLGGMIVLAVGAWDDVRPVRPAVKLLAQIAAGLILAWGGATVDRLSAPGLGEVTLGAWGTCVTVIWVVALSNAVNLIDGLDGLAGGVSFIAALSLAVIGSAIHAPAITLLCGALAGCMLAFLYFNLSPSRLFLGDSGALLVGYIFAVASLLAPIKTFAAATLLPPLVTLAVPLGEVALSIFRRLRAGRSIIQADRGHLFHLLGHLGISPQATVRLFWAAGAVCGLAGVLMPFGDKRLALMILLTGWFVIYLVFHILRTRRRDA